MNGKDRNKDQGNHIDLGLAVCEAISSHGTPMTQIAIAAACNCSQGMIYLIEVEAKKKFSERVIQIMRELDVDILL